MSFPVALLAIAMATWFHSTTGLTSKSVESGSIFHSRKSSVSKFHLPYDRKLLSNEFNGYPGDDFCVSSFPNMCRFVDEMPIPETIDGSNGKTITLGAFNIHHSLHRDLPLTPMYGYGQTLETATAPGPTLIAKRNIMTKVKWENHLQDFNYTLPDSLAGLVANGSIPITMHLHGGETEPQSDGHPYAWFTATGEKGPKFVKSIHSYHNGQLPSTLWYHDHTFAMTMHNVYLGLAGMYILKDPEGTEKGFELPASEFDIPLVIQNKLFEESGRLHESLGVDDDRNVVVGGFMTVNGKGWPYYNVQKTMYRFRMLNGANLMLLNVSFFVVDEGLKNKSAVGLDWVIPSFGKFLTFQQIACDGGYLNEPFSTELIQLVPSERVEVLVDFSAIADSNDYVEVLMLNSGDISTSDYGIPSDSKVGILAKFILAPTAKKYPIPRVPKVMNSVPEVSTASVTRTRWITLAEVETDADRLHLIGMHKFEFESTEILEEGSTEVWAIVNLTPQTHTIHLHVVKFQVLSRQTLDSDRYFAGNCSLLFPENSSSCFEDALRKPESGSEMGWKDSLLVKDYEVTMIVVRATTQSGQRFPFNATAFPGYVWHCHMLEHEDEEMMRPVEFRRPKQALDYDKILVDNSFPDLSRVDN